MLTYKIPIVKCGLNCCFAQNSREKRVVPPFDGYFVFQIGLHLLQKLVGAICTPQLTWFHSRAKNASYLLFAPHTFFSHVSIILTSSLKNLHSFQWRPQVHNGSSNNSLVNPHCPIIIHQHFQKTPLLLISMEGGENVESRNWK